MIIQVRKASAESWYNEAIGMKFEAWKSPLAPGVYFIHDKLFILGEDCEVINGKEKENTESITFN